VVGLLGLGLGALVRNTAGAVCILIGALFGLQLLLALLPEGIQRVDRFLPGPAGLAVTAVHPDPNALAPWAGLGVFCAYAAVVLAAAAYRLRRADA
jgi:hypothetical protein